MLILFSLICLIDLVNYKLSEHSPIRPRMDELGEDNLNENVNSASFHASNLSGDKINDQENCEKITYNHML